MKKFDLVIFLNKFYSFYLALKSNPKILSKLKLIYGLNIYSCYQICIIFGIKFNSMPNLTRFEWTNIYLFLRENFNFFLFDLKVKNVRKIRFLKTYKGWRHIFNLPVRGQRSHTNAKTRKKFKIT